jgi:lipopolysaccharide assembly outer membrane protein LptD (OstA)
MKGVKLDKKIYKILANSYYVLFMLLCLLFSSCKQNAINKTINLNSYVQMIKNFKLIYTTDKGNLKFVVEAQLAYYNNINLIHLYKPLVVFYKNGNCIAILNSIQIDINTKTYDFQSNGQCILQILNKAILTANQIIYNATKELIYIYGNITVTTPDNITIYGKEIQTDVQMKNIIIKGYKILIA